MRLFAIDNDNTITAFPAAEQIPEGQEQFASEKELVIPGHFCSPALTRRLWPLFFTRACELGRIYSQILSHFFSWSVWIVRSNH